MRALLPARWNQALLGWIGRVYPKGDYLPQRLRAKAFLTNVARTPWEAYLFSVSAFKEQDKRRLLAPDVQKQLGAYRTAELFEHLYAHADGPDPLARAMSVDFNTYLPDDILTKVDRASMAHGLEVRCPLLDHRLVEFAARLPSCRKIRNGRTKVILREAVGDLVPADVLRRPKMGFVPPIRDWLRGPLRGLVEDLVLAAGRGTACSPTRRCVSCGISTVRVGATGHASCGASDVQPLVRPFRIRHSDMPLTSTDDDGSPPAIILHVLDHALPTR